MTRAAAVLAVMGAVEIAETWRRATTPVLGAQWDPAQSRDLSDADEAIDRLRALAAYLAESK